MNRFEILMAAIVCGSVANQALADSPPPTFSKDVAEIIHGKCSVCHRPDASGPFSLLTYADVQRNAETIDAVLESNYMPPWKPVDHGIAFANDRSLSTEEKQTIQSWIEAECPEGDPGKTPASPKFAEGWTLGKPDLVVRMNGQYRVPADGPDIYRSFVFPLNLPNDKWVKAVELRPTAKSAVHHAIFFLDPAGNARELDGADGQPGISGMGFLANFDSDPRALQEAPPGKSRNLFQRMRGSGNRNRTPGDDAARSNNALARGLGGYVPGSIPNVLPEGLSMPLPRGSDIVMQTHFHPSGKPEIEQAELALYFADRPSARQLIPIMVPSMFGFGSGIKIPAGEKNYVISDSIVLPVDTQAIGVNGHAHYLCREMQMTATLPNGETMVLLQIDDWDLDWQDQYQFAHPVDLPAKTRLESRIVYDNSSDNPENPFYPPQEIRWGRGSSDEMGSITLITVASDQRDEAALQNAVRQKLVATFANRDPSEMIQMLMQLDDNRDGKLQPAEAPARLNSQAFRLLDANRDGGIDEREFSRILKLRQQFPFRR